jgi:hypothetical protein
LHRCCAWVENRAEWECADEYEFEDEDDGFEQTEERWERSKGSLRDSVMME